MLASTCCVTGDAAGNRWTSQFDGSSHGALALESAKKSTAAKGYLNGVGLRCSIEAAPAANPNPYTYMALGVTHLSLVAETSKV